MISIQPKWVAKICRGEKTVEVRKTKPKLETPFKCYIYCTKGRGDCLWRWGGGVWYDTQFPNERPNRLDGKIIGEFVCDRIVQFENSWYDPAFYETSDLSCVGFEELAIYIGKKDFGYGWHITDLVVYDEPRELSEFYHYCGDDPNCSGCEAHYFSNTECGKEDYCCSPIEGCKPIKRAPQSWQFCVATEPRQTAD